MKINNGFVFSKNNKCNQEPCAPILAYINEYVDIFEDVEEKGIEIKCKKEDQYNRIKKLYSNEKNSPYFITFDGINFIIFKTIL